MVHLVRVFMRAQLTGLAEWFTLMYKEKYCGEVYLELTFWSNVSYVLALRNHLNHVHG